MPTPRTRRLSTPIEAGKDVTPTEVVFNEDGNDAEIVEQIGGKTVHYNAKVKKGETENEREDQTNDREFANLDDIDESANYPQIQKTPLDNLFDDIQFSVENENLYDSFFAKLVREADAINDRFNIPCKDIVELGVIQFSSLDRFNFIPAVQKTNGNSGGRFSIAIFTHDYKAFETMRNMSFRARPVGLKLVVQNPAPEPIAPVNSNNGNNEMAQILAKMVEMQQANHNQLMQAMHRKPDKSTLELAIEQKVLNDILNPPTNNNSNNGNDIIASVMQSAAVVTGLSDAFARNLNREPKADPEPDWIDKLNKIADSPVAKELIERVGDIGEAIAVSRLNLPANAQADSTNNNNMQNPTEQQPPQEITEAQSLILDIIDELESENALDATNETIKELQGEYPDQFSDLVSICQSGMPFDSVFNLLTNRASKMQPFPFLQFLDLEQTNTQQKHVWNGAGLKLIERLKELYEYLKTVTV